MVIFFRMHPCIFDMNIKYFIIYEIRKKKLTKRFAFDVSFQRHKIYFIQKQIFSHKITQKLKQDKITQTSFTIYIKKNTIPLIHYAKAEDYLSTETLFSKTTQKSHRTRQNNPKINRDFFSSINTTLIREKPHTRTPQKQLLAGVGKASKVTVFPGEKIPDFS